MIEWTKRACYCGGFYMDCAHALIHVAPSGACVASSGSLGGVVFATLDDALGWCADRSAA